MLTTELIFAAYALLFAFALGACSKSLLGIFQQEGYSARALGKWYVRKGNMLRRRYSLLALSLFLITALLSLVFSFAGVRIAQLIAAAGFLGIGLFFAWSARKGLKVPLACTKRLIRLAVCYWLVLALVLFGLGNGLYFAAEAIGHDLARTLVIVPFSLVALVLPWLLSVANFIMAGYEIPHGRKFLKKAKATLSASNCIKVGITGSFGKTSVKNFAAQILSQKYRVIATPASYNTPLGIARCVNEGGADCDIFLAEMGARRVGDIQELCDLVQPSVGVVTGVCAQHLETFGSLENIVHEKGALARCTKKTVLGVSAAGMKEDALAEGRDFAAENILLSPEGTSFTLRVGGERTEVKTALLGRHAAQDVALAAALCRELGMTLGEIAAAIPSLEPVPHRLQKLEGNGLNILDDSYNSNTAGAKDAVEVLKLFSGRRAVVTPGLVELGELEEKANEELGASLVGLELVVLVGETRVLALRSGYLAAGGEEKRLKIVPSLEAAQAVLTEELTAGDCVLFLNDLPDKYA